ncbi:uncharacterized protein [Euwallacea fornicatus]|uniref:uncharacterized protein isoform X2 n=1 Tax=Euwallacea fornicatus TaxID=995702 RepID=UPI00338EE9C2
MSSFTLLFIAVKPMGNILCCLAKRNNTTENVTGGMRGPQQQFRPGRFDGSQNERRGRTAGLEIPEGVRSYQNEAQVPNVSMAREASKKFAGNKNPPKGQCEFQNVRPLIVSHKAKTVKTNWGSFGLTLSDRIEARQSPSSHSSEPKNHTKPIPQEFDRMNFKNRAITTDATFTQANAQSQTQLERISTTNSKKNNSKPFNHQADLSQQRQIADTTVPSPTAFFHPVEIESEGNDVKNTKNRSSTYDNVTPDQHLPSTPTSPRGLDYRGSSQKSLTNFSPTMITNSSTVNLVELSKDYKTANKPPKMNWIKSKNKCFTLHQRNTSSLKNFAPDESLSSVCSSPINNSWISAYDENLGETSGMPRELSGVTATSTEVDELSLPKRQKVLLPEKAISHDDAAKSRNSPAEYSNYTHINQGTEYEKRNDDFGPTPQSLHYKNINPPINDFDPFEHDRDFSSASLGVTSRYVAEEKIYPVPLARSSSKFVLKRAHLVETLPEDLIQLDSKEREYAETHFPVNDESEDNRIWNSEKKDISSGDKVDELDHSKNFQVDPKTQLSYNFHKQISQSINVSQKESSQEIKWNVEESCREDTESSNSGLNLAFEPKAISETNKSSPEALGYIDSLLRIHATEEPSKKADDPVSKVPVDLIDPTDAAADEAIFYTSSLTTLSTEECPKKIYDTAEENVDFKTLSNANGDARPDQQEGTREKQLDDGSRFYDEATEEPLRFFGKDATIYERKPQYSAFDIDTTDIQERYQEKQGTPSAEARQINFSSLVASKPAIETSEDISRNNTLKDDAANPPTRTDQHFREGQAFKFDEELRESLVKSSGDSSILQFSAANPVDNEDARTSNGQELINSLSMSKRKTTSWSSKMSEDSNSFPSIESTIHFDAISQRNRSPVIDPSANYSYDNHFDLGTDNATGLPYLQPRDKKPKLDSDLDFQESVYHKPHYEFREIAEDYGKGQFPAEFNIDWSNCDIKSMVKSLIKSTEGVIPPPSEPVCVEEATLEAETQFPKALQAEGPSKSDTDEDNQTELQKRIIQNLEQIRQKAKPFEKEIEDFTELEDSNKHYYIEESLRRLIDKLDDLYDDIGDDHMLRLKRKEVYRYIFPMFDDLDNKVKFNRSRIENNLMG